MATAEPRSTLHNEGSSGKDLSARPRRQTVFYEPEAPAEKQTFRVPKGSGTRLRDIPAISATLTKIRADDPLLQDIHRMLFRRTGVKTKRKRDIGDFSGFDFEKDEMEAEVEKLKERIGHSRGLKKLVDFFDLPVKSGKDKMLDAIADFLIKPENARAAKRKEPPPRVGPAPQQNAPVERTCSQKETPKKKASKKVSVTQKRKAEEPMPKRPSKKRGKRTKPASNKRDETVGEETAR